MMSENHMDLNFYQQEIKNAMINKEAAMNRVSL